jgi:hypothetical protein
VKREKEGRKRSVRLSGKRGEGREDRGRERKIGKDGSENARREGEEE